MLRDSNDNSNKKVPVYVYPHIRKLCRNCGGALRKSEIGVIDKRLQNGLAICMKCRRRVTSIGFYLAHTDDFACINISEMEKALENRKAKIERKRARKETSKEETTRITEVNKPLHTQPSEVNEENPDLLTQAKKNKILEIVSQTNQKLSKHVIERFKAAWLKVNLSLTELDSLSSVYFVRNNDKTISSIIISRKKAIKEHNSNGIRFITSRSELAKSLYECNENHIPDDSYIVIEKIYFKDLSTQPDSLKNNITTQQKTQESKGVAKKVTDKKIPNSYEDIKTVYVYFRLSNACMKNKHQIESVTAETTNAKNGANVHVNVFHCKNCDKYFINYEALQRYISNGVYPALPYILSNDISGSLHDASKLMLYGYRVAEGTLTRQERQSILSWVIDSSLLSKSEIIKDLQFKVRYNGSKPGNEKAKAKWEDDIQFVSRYVKDNKTNIKATYILRNKN